MQVRYDTESPRLLFHLDDTQVYYVRSSVAALSKALGSANWEKFHGGAADTGAQKSVIGIRQS